VCRGGDCGLALMAEAPGTLRAKASERFAHDEDVSFALRRCLKHELFGCPVPVEVNL